MVHIRQATADDAKALHELIVEIATHHHQLDSVVCTPETLGRDGFSPAARFNALLAFVDEQLVGYLSYTVNYSIWLGTSVLNIDDVFVRDTQRGLGIGEALMHEARKVCRANGLTRLRWEVESNNAAAIRFYERLGATLRTKGIFSWSA